MKEQEKVFQELKKITQELIRCGLAEEYNVPIIKQTDIVWGNFKDVSLYLKNMDYSKIYSEMERDHNYNIKLPDGGILQLMYRFNGRGTELQSHRLAYYPSPSYEIYQNDADLYTSFSCPGRQIIYRQCHLGIDIHFKNHYHQLLLFMTKVGERTLEEVPVSVLFSQGTVMLGPPVITGASQFLQ